MHADDFFGSVKFVSRAFFLILRCDDGGEEQEAPASAPRTRKYHIQIQFPLIYPRFLQFSTRKSTALVFQL